MPCQLPPFPAKEPLSSRQRCDRSPAAGHGRVARCARRRDRGGASAGARAAAIGHRCRCAAWRNEASLLAATQALLDLALTACNLFAGVGRSAQKRVRRSGQGGGWGQASKLLVSPQDSMHILALRLTCFAPFDTWCNTANSVLGPVQTSGVTSPKTSIQIGPERPEHTVGLHHVCKPCRIDRNYLHQLGNVPCALLAPLRPDKWLTYLPLPACAIR